MVYMVFAFMLFVINCNAQEHLTCLRTDDVLYPSRQPPPRIKQGIPGKRGPRGEAGLTGSKGEKGEPGVPDVSEINMLRGNITLLRQQLHSFRNQITAALHRGYIELNEGWFSPFNGYQYKVTTRTTWQNSRSSCQTMGADFAVYGVQDNNLRRIFYEKIRQRFWIGLSDVATEGRWLWVNGQTGVDDPLWHTNQPDDSRGRQDCAYIVRWDQLLKADDIICSTNFVGLCEKPI